MGQHLSLTVFGKAARGQPRSEPDSGKPTVRDRRGACGNVAVMGVGLRAIGKLMEHPPNPKAGSASHFYPDFFPQGSFYVCNAYANATAVLIARQAALVASR
jgi:hypothetical protein